mgnify:CR=1 FL=1
MQSIPYELYESASLDGANLTEAFERMQAEQLVRVRLEAVSLDSTIVKVHPDGTGARKKTARRPSAAPAEAGPPKFIWLPRIPAAR